MIIEKANLKHNGLLSAIAENESGKTETSTKIEILPSLKPAKIIDGLQNIAVFEKETVEFKATVLGVPKPTVRWSVNETVKIYF